MENISSSTDHEFNSLSSSETTCRNSEMNLLFRNIFELTPDDLENPTSPLLNLPLSQCQSMEETPGKTLTSSDCSDNVSPPVLPKKANMSYQKNKRQFEKILYEEEFVSSDNHGCEYYVNTEIDDVRREHEIVKDKTKQKNDAYHKAKLATGVNAKEMNSEKYERFENKRKHEKKQQVKSLPLKCSQLNHNDRKTVTAAHRKANMLSKKESQDTVFRLHTTVEVAQSAGADVEDLPAEYKEDNNFYYDNMEIMSKYKLKNTELEQLSDTDETEIQKNSPSFKSQGLSMSKEHIVSKKSNTSEQKPPALPPKQKNLLTTLVQSQPKMTVALSNHSESSKHTNSTLQQETTGSKTKPFQHNVQEQILATHRDQEASNDELDATLLQQQKLLQQRKQLLIRQQNQINSIQSQNSPGIRSLVDEPLFPILEEGSSHGNSSDEFSENDQSEIDTDTDISTKSYDENRNSTHSLTTESLDAEECQTGESVSNRDVMAKGKQSSDSYSEFENEVECINNDEDNTDAENVEFPITSPENNVASNESKFRRTKKSEGGEGFTTAQVEEKLAENVSPYGMIELSRLEKTRDHMETKKPYKSVNQSMDNQPRFSEAETNNQTRHREYHEISSTLHPDKVVYDNIEKYQGNDKPYVGRLCNIQPKIFNRDSPIATSNYQAQNKERNTPDVSFRSNSNSKRNPNSLKNDGKRRLMFQDANMGKHSTAVSSLDRHGASLSSNLSSEIDKHSSHSSSPFSAKSKLSENSYTPKKISGDTVKQVTTTQKKVIRSEENLQHNQFPDPVENTYEEIKFFEPETRNRKVISEGLEGKKARIQEILDMMETPDSLYQLKTESVQQFPVTHEDFKYEPPQYDNFVLPQKLQDTSIPSSNISRSEILKSNNVMESSQPPGQEFKENNSYTKISMSHSERGELTKTFSLRKKKHHTQDQDCRPSKEKSNSQKDSSEVINKSELKYTRSHIRNFDAGNLENKNLQQKYSDSSSPANIHIARRARTSVTSKSALPLFEAAKDHGNSNSEKETKHTLHTSSLSFKASQNDNEHEKTYNRSRPKSLNLKETGVTTSNEKHSTSSQLERGRPTTNTTSDNTKQSLKLHPSSERKKSPLRSRFKLRRFRSKSQDRLPTETTSANEIDLGCVSGGDESAKTKRKGESRLSRRMSRKSTERRGRSVECSNTDDESASKSRGRNPVNFIRRLLRKERDSDVDLSQDKLSDHVNREMSSKSTEVPYATSEKQYSTLPRSKEKKSRFTTPMKSPPSHRAKKMLHSKPVRDHSTDSSSDETPPGKHRERMKPGERNYRELGNNRSQLAMSKKHFYSNRSDSLSNSAASTDSERDLQRYQRVKEANDNTSEGSIAEFDIRKNTSDTAGNHSTSTEYFSDDKAFTETSSLKSKNRVKNFPGVKLTASKIHQSAPSVFPQEKGLDENKYAYDDRVSHGQEYSAWRQRTGKGRRQAAPLDVMYASQQRQKYKTLVSLNAQTLSKITEKWLIEWKNQLPVGGFLITSWSDVVLTSKRPQCILGNSVVYLAQFATNTEHKIACQLFEQSNVSSRQLRQLENCSTLTTHPNLCSVCSHFHCRIPRYLLDPSSGENSIDAICVVLASRPKMTLLDYITNAVGKTDIHKEILIILIQILQGINDLEKSGFNLPCISIDHIVVTQDRGLVQVLPHMDTSEGNLLSPTHQRQKNNKLTVMQQVSQLVKWMIKSETIEKRRSDNSSKKYVSASTSSSHYLFALDQIMLYLNRVDTPVDLRGALSLAQCALWGPENLEGADFDNVISFHALELWIDMEQAKLVNSLAVLLTGKNELMPTSVFLKHQYFANVNPENLFNSLEILQRL